MKAIRIEEFGGPEVLQLVDVADPDPADGEIVVDVTRAGINFADTMQRENLYLAEASLPLVPGGEIAGTAPDGRRVAALLAGGGYAQKVAVPERHLVPLPDEVSDDVAAALLLQGLTARTILTHLARVQEGDSVVVQAAAGGTGTLAIQLAKRLKAGRVIALASTEEKRELAKRLGADAAVDSRSDELREAIVEANGGEAVDVVMEMTGGETFDQCLRALAPFGRMVVYGIASRERNQVSSRGLMRYSTAVIGFWLPQLFTRPELAREGIVELVGAVAAGELEVIVGGVYPLSEAAKAHEDLAARRTHGKLLLDPAK